MDSLKLMTATSSIRYRSAAIDIGGTALKTGIVEVTPNGLYLLDYKRLPLPNNELITLTDLIEQFLESIDLNAVGGIDISTPGTVSRQITQLRDNNHSDPLVSCSDKFAGYQNFSWRIQLNKFDKPISVSNDGQCCALGIQQSDFIQTERLLALTLGTHIGGSLIWNGEIFVGHECLLLCSSTLCTGSNSVTPFIDSRWLIDSLGGAAMTRQLKGDATSVDPTAINDAISELSSPFSSDLPHARTKDIFRQQGELLASLASGLSALLAPQVIVLGGGIIDASDGTILHHTKLKFGEISCGASQTTTIVESKRRNPNLLGAAVVGSRVV